MAYLKQAFGDGADKTSHPINGDSLTIGRHDKCDVIVDSPSVSRYHARISVENSCYFIEDLGSRNGTLVNGRNVTRKTQLGNGDRLEVSNLPFVFYSEDSLDEESGKWGYRPIEISVSDVSDLPGATVSRQTVRRGDEVSYEQLGREPLQDSQILARVAVADGNGSELLRDDSARKLKHVLRLTRNLRRAIRSDEILSVTLQTLFEAFSAAECVSVMIHSSARTGLEVAAAAAREEGRAAQICLPVLLHSMQCFEAVLFADSDSQAAVGTADSQPVTRCILSAPLVDRTMEAFGVIQVDTGRSQQSLTHGDLQMLAVLSQLISMALENAKEIDLEVSRALIEHSLENAVRLKTTISPLAAPRIPGFRWGYQIMTSPDLAADLIDFVTLSDGRIACLVIDVPGRGAVATNLLVGLTRTLLGTLTETGSAAAALQKTELELVQRLGSVPMITSVGVMILNPRHSTVTVTVAGHCVLAAIRDGKVEMIADEHVIGPPLGTGRKKPCPEHCLSLENSDSLLLFSDGITRLVDPFGRMLDRDALVKTIESAAAATESEFDVGLRKALENYRDGSPVPDDVAIAVLQRRTDGTPDKPAVKTQPQSWQGSETWDML